MDEIKEINRKILKINSEIKELYKQMGKLENGKVKSERDQRNVGILINNLETCAMNLLTLKASTLIKTNRVAPEEEEELDR